MESRKTKDGEDNFGGLRRYVHLVHIDALSTLTGGRGLSFYPEIPLQHKLL